MHDFSKYEVYLEFLEKRLKRFEEKEKPYIFCKEGCSLCCEIGNYPFSKLEFDYIVHGSLSLPKEVIETIDSKIFELKKQKESSKEEPFMHECPFLIDKKCCLYQYRGLICRTFGLIFYDENDKFKIPSCVNNGLNYSNVYDKQTKMISKEKVEQLGLPEPVAYNLSLKFLKENKEVKDNLDFGETKPLLDWFE